MTRKMKLRKPTAQIRGILRSAKLQNRRETLCKMLMKRHGRVPCFVCGENVNDEDATLEHIVPTSKGGTDDMSNLSISHEKCNNDRGNATRD